MNNPFFSIIIPTYNRANFILDTIDSVLNQTFKDFEIIIVDDGSTDNTKDVINSINNTKVNYIYQENAERSAARNNGGSVCKGSYLIFLDSNDFFKEDHLLKLYNFIKKCEKPDSLIISNFFYKDNDKLNKYSTPPLTNNLVEYFFNNPIIPARVCISKNIFKKFKFNNQITIVEDSILWSDISVKFPVLINPSYSVIYNIHNENSISLKNYSAIKRLKGLKIFFKTETSNYLSNGFKKNLISNCYYMIAQSHELHNQKTKCVLNTIISIFYESDTKYLKAKIFLILCQIPGFKSLWKGINR